MSRRVLGFGLAALIIAVLVVLGLADDFFVDLLWFASLGYGSVFRTMIAARFAVFAIAWILSFAAFCISGLSALQMSGERERLRIVRRADDLTEINLPELIRSLGERIPWRTLVIGASVLLALFVATGESANWDTYLKAIYAVPFGSTEPVYGHDIGFYIFTLPMFEELRDFALLLIFFATAVGAGVYWARGAIDFREAPPRIAPGVITHVSLLLGLFFLQRAFGYWIDRFGLLLHTNGVVFGFRYVDQMLWRPGMWFLIGLSIVAAVLCFANVVTRGVRNLVLAAAVVFVPAIVLSFLQPIIERLFVKPDELTIERQFLARNIELTRRAYKLDTIDVKPFKGSGLLTPASLTQDAPTIKNIRLWDPRPLLATYRQLQEIRLYYDFKDVEVDRYRIGGNYSEVMLSARELNPDLLPENARTWVNQHLKFTHGAGLAMSPVNAKDSEGLPIFYIKDIPPTSSVGLQITRPAIYYGEEPDNYVVVKAATPEFDYPKGTDNVFSFYQSDSGIHVSGLLHRALFGYFFRDFNLLVTDNIGPNSRILIRRNIKDRIQRLAPFLAQDRDPYIVLHNGMLSWIVDCYTTSDHYPYSQPNPDRINYIRNAVKVVVDAYTGETVFYIADPDDPIIKCWSRIFPALFRPLSAMPADLQAHVRYPEDLFLVQADIYRAYHMTDPQVFYNREDMWGFPRENYGGETVNMQPYYVIMRLPGESDAEFILMLPMVPQGRDNMISWLAARCDGSSYGHLIEYAFSKDMLIYGPYQIQARINQNPEISRQMSLWNQMGSRVILGNLIIMPIKDSLLYVEPLYIRAENGQLPELQRVIASYSDRVVMGEDLDETLAALFTGVKPQAPQIAALPPPASAPSGQAPAATVVAQTNRNEAPQPALHSASDHYNRALAALRSGDWNAFGQEMQKLGQVLEPGADHH
jgi:uncharacterized membrane protein (UPF0182 family)